MRKLTNKLCVILVLILPVVVWAHEGEQHGTPAPTTKSTGGSTVRLSEQAKINLGLKTEMADLRPIEKTVKGFGIVEAVPDNVNYISVQSSGQVLRVPANQGDIVKKGDLLAEIESRQIGDPPPTINVYASMSGIVTERNLFVGESVDPGRVMFRISDLSKVHVKGQVYESDVSKIKAGQKARVYLEAYPDESFTGTIKFLGGELDEKTQSLPVWFVVDNPELKLRPNMRAEVRIITGSGEEILTVPLSAVMGDTGNYFVYVEDGNIYRRRTVVTGKRDDRYIEIVKGLIPGDTVVTQGNYQLQFVTGPPEPGSKKPAESKPKEKN